MRQLGVLVTIGLLAGLVWSGGELAGGVRDARAAATQVPSVTNLRATPSKFCTRKSNRCRHPGTTVRFNVSTDAKVRGDVTPRFENVGMFVEFVKHFKRGANSIRLNDKRMTPGRWTLRLQATNNVGSGGIAETDLIVVKRR
jgi:hypothetical protein